MPLVRPVTVLVLVWNRWDLTSRCLASLSRYTDLESTEILVVDNGSTDETPERLAAWPGIRVLRLPENSGFVRGNNAGMKTIAADRDVILLNNDTEILSSGWVEALQQTALSAPDIGIAGCRLVLPDRRLLHAGTYVMPDTSWGQQIGSLERDVNQFSTDRDVEGIVFACAYIRRETIESIGLLSEEFESYFEDTDYCLRAREAGLRTRLCGAVTILHHEHGSTDGNTENFERLFFRSRDIFSAKWREKLENRYTHSVTWRSILNFPIGYAMSSREILRALDRRGVRAAYRYAYGPGTPFSVEEPSNSGDYMLNVLSGREVTSPITVTYAQGDVFEAAEGQYRVGFTMLEVDGFPAEWVRQANQMDEVWVPTELNRQQMLRCGVKRPVHIVPLGVDLQRFHPAARSLRNPYGDFIFLAVFEWGERKLPELVEIFNRTFRRSERVVLLAKVSNRDSHVRLRELIRQMKLDSDGGRVVFLNNREIAHTELPALYTSSDAFISAARGEGWNMPLLEAMACGLPSIATEWGGHTAFANESNVRLLRSRGMVPAEAKCPYYEGFSWADPDPEHLSQLMREMFEQKSETKHLAERAAADAARWSWDNSARAIFDRLTDIQRRLGGAAQTETLS